MNIKSMLSHYFSQWADMTNKRNKYGFPDVTHDPKFEIAYLFIVRIIMIFFFLVGVIIFLLSTFT